ncbi:MAG: diguanylate cyclase, partial [Acidaminobacteraceae bacterium]
MEYNKYVAKKIEEVEKIEKEILKNSSNNPWKVILIYFIFGFMWITFSDNLLSFFVKDISTYKIIQTYKGIFYIAITTFMLYVLIKLEYSKKLKLSFELSTKNQEIIAYSEELLTMDEELKSKIKTLDILNMELNEQKEYVYEIYNTSNTLIIVWNLDGTVLDVNNYCLSLLGYKKEELVGRNWFKTVLAEDYKITMDRVTSELIENGQLINVENAIFDINGNKITMLWNDSVMKTSVDGNLIVTSFGINITKEKEQEEEIFDILHKDKLTALNNRLVLSTDIEKWIREKENFTIFFIDIDNFKNLNNLYGHKFGDQFLIEYSKLLNKTFQDYYIYRWGGDEFLIVEKTNEDSKALKTITNLMEISKRTWNINEIEVKSSISIGITKYPVDGDTFSELFKNADMALYKAKDNGRNRYEFYNEELNKEVEFRIKVDNALAKAIENDEFELVFQPLYRFDDGKIYSFEVLIRWYKHEFENLSTGDFIKIAEETGLIMKIDKWVMENTFRIISRNLKNYKNVNFSINVSTQTFNSEEFVGKLNSLISKYDINSENIH